jgi:hypothetical protein
MTMETRTQPFTSTLEFNVWAERFAQHVAQTMEQRADERDDFSTYSKSDLEEHIVEQLHETEQDIDVIFEGYREYATLFVSRIEEPELTDEQWEQYQLSELTRSIGWRTIHELGAEYTDVEASSFHGNLVADPDPAPYLWELHLQDIDQTMIVLPNGDDDRNPRPDGIWNDDDIEARIVWWQ